ncbi:MAG: hypothetical protein JWM33_922, partial [Caulobacteraceae bacterium]|nr:hypothetical protein [Caulobacteraceae bacterium]
DTFADGWALTVFSNTTATLSRNGQNHTVGLNPSGAIAQARADDPATTVNVVGLAELAQLQARQIALGQLLKEQLGPWDGKTPRLGLTLEETQRYVAYQSRGKQAEGHKDPLGRAGFLTVDQVSSLGADRLDYMTLNQKLLRGLFNGSGFTPLMYSVSRVPADEVNSLVAGRASTQDNVQMAQDVLAGSFAAIISAPPEDLSTIKLIQSQGDLSLSVGRLNFPLSAAAIAASGGL